MIAPSERTIIAQWWLAAAREYDHAGLIWTDKDRQGLIEVIGKIGPHGKLVFPAHFLIGGRYVDEETAIFG